MPPAFHDSGDPLLVPRRDFNPGATSAAFRDEWTNPSNYAFTILLLIGGDLVNRALAQLAGGWLTPVAFSFGKSRSPFPLSQAPAIDKFGRG
jgi:hypothetical protein